MSYGYRCTDRSNCGKHVTLKRKKEEYVREPKCPVCKGKISPYHHARPVCKCDGVHHPHRPGSVPLCVHTKMTEGKLAKYLGVDAIETFGDPACDQSVDPLPEPQEGEEDCPF